jgi:predicted RND superfamily exporter protein
MNEPEQTLAPTTVFGRIAVFAMTRRKPTLIALAVSLVVAIACASQLRIDTNLLNLMPSDEPFIQALHQLERSGSGMNLLTINVRGPDDDVTEFLTELSAELVASDNVEHAIFDLDPELCWRIGVFQLPPSELRAIRDRLQGALALGPASANPLIASRLFDLGPLTDKLTQADCASMLKTESGLTRMVIKPVTPPQDVQFARVIVAEVDAALERLDPAARNVEVVWIGGPYRHNVEDYEAVIADMSLTGIVAFSLVFGLLSLAFRDFKVLGLIFAPLLFGTAWTFGFAGVTVGYLNMFTSFFGAILVGLGIDFTVHLYARYREEKERIRGVEEAVVKAWDAVGPPCAAAALTTMGGFMALLFARFQGFSQFGLLLGVGVMFCLLSVLIVLPLLIQWRERSPIAWVRTVPQGGVGPPPNYRGAPLTLLLLLLVTCVCALLVPRNEFEYDVSELRPQGRAFSDLNDDQQELVMQSFTPLVATYPDMTSLRAGQDNIQNLIDKEALPEISKAFSLASLLPVDMDERLELVGQIAALSAEPNFQYLPPPVQANLAQLGGAELSPLNRDDLPVGLLHLLGAAEGGSRLLMIPTGNMWDLRDCARLVEIMPDKIPDAPIASQYLGMGRLFQVVKHDGPRVTVLALVFVLIGALFDLRRVKDALASVAVLTSGMLWAGAALSILNIKISIVNFIGIPILLGIGVDVVIHLQHRLREEGPGGVSRVLATTGWAAAVSVTTTALSFASLAFASSQGIKSLGLLVLVGLAAVTFCAFAMLPIGWMAAWKDESDKARRES